MTQYCNRNVAIYHSQTLSELLGKSAKEDAEIRLGVGAQVLKAESSVGSEISCLIFLATEILYTQITKVHSKMSYMSQSNLCILVSFYFFAMKVFLSN